jgi:uncharacterized protein (DUF2147 family)
MGFEAGEGYGLRWSSGRWLYGSPTRLAWVPYGLSSSFQTVWNAVACGLLGHEWHPDFCQQDMRGIVTTKTGERQMDYHPCGREVCMYCMAERRS